MRRWITLHERRAWRGGAGKLRDRRWSQPQNFGGSTMGPLSGALAFATFLLATLFLPCSAYAQELNDVAHKFLRRHGVPCVLVVKVGSPRDMGEVATCQDGREWALFWLEDEIAFVHPQTHESYRWDRQIHLSHPEIYAGPNPSSEHRILASDGP
jgi:hypothetical protein